MADGVRNHIFPCNLCNETFTNLGGHSRHVQQKHEGRMYHCTYCGKKYTRNENFKKHLTLFKGPCPLRELESLSKALILDNDNLYQPIESTDYLVDIMLEALQSTVDEHPGYLHTDQNNNTEESNYPHWGNIAGNFSSINPQLYIL